MSKKKKYKKQIQEQDIVLCLDETYAFVAGYTSWGFPYGSAWEAQGGENEESLDEELPFG